MDSMGRSKIMNILRERDAIFNARFGQATLGCCAVARFLIYDVAAEPDGAGSATSATAGAG